MTIDKSDIKLAKEAEYQNARTTGKLDYLVKRRSKFYYLANTAKLFYDETIYGDAAGKNIIVVGCADGGVTPLARKDAKMVLGIDIADEPIRKLNNSIKAEGLAHNAKAVVGNAEDIDVPAGSYDLICCSGVLHHLDIKRAMKSWSKSLSADGKVVMMEPMAMNPVIFLYRILTPSMRTEDEHPLLPRDIKILHQHFNKVEITGFVLTSLLSLTFSYLPNIFSLREKSCRFFENLDTFLLKLFPPLIYLCWTSVIVLKEPKQE